MSEKLHITLATLAVGEGNPLAQAAAAEQLQRAGHPVTQLVINNPLVRLAALVHRQMTMSETARQAYARNYETSRQNPVTQLIGLLALLQISHSVATHRSQTLILTQELPLTAYHALEQLKYTSASAALAQLRQILLLIPDVEAKSTAIATLRQLKDKLPVAALVWNKQAANSLRQHDIPYQPVAPWILPPHIHFDPHETPKPRAILRPSGSGIDPKHLAGVPKLVKQYSPTYLHGFDVFAQLGKQQHDRHGKKQLDLPSQFRSLPELCAAMLRANPQLLISYPSEMMQVIAQAISAGWRGEHYSLPPRGHHESSNLAWAAALGLTSAVTITGDQVVVRRPDAPINLDAVKNALNQPNLVQAILRD